MATTTTNTATCPKCHGEGWLERYAGRQNGKCYACNGKGTISAALAARMAREDAALLAKVAADAAAYSAQIEAEPVRCKGCNCHLPRGLAFRVETAGERFTTYYCPADFAAHR